MYLSDFEINIIDGHYIVLDSWWNRKNACDPFSRLYYIKSGVGYLKYGDNTVTLKPGFVYIVPADLTFDYRCDEGDVLEKLYFHISVMSVENYEIFSGINKICALPMEKVGCEDIFDEFENETYAGMLKLKMMLYKTICGFIEEYGFEFMPLNKYSALVKSVMEYVKANTRITLTIGEISRDLFVSESKLRNTFKNETGITLGSYIDDMVFYRAKRMLVNKKYSMGDISSALGFCDQFYFSRRFREKNGVTPSYYRRKNLNESDK
ncbi:MAG: helix-turn-helix transcriptional regulator [Clostridia bacterium]|nr:helix-turn-helix transcriptional regulator [Clostridia bacterium]